MSKKDRFFHISQYFLLISTYLTLINAQENKDSCWSPSTEYIISSSSENNTRREIVLTEEELIDECHLSFVQKLTNRTCSASTAASRPQSTAAQKYGFGFLAVFIISILSLAGFVAFPLMKKPYYKYLNAFFTALAVGTLFSDIVFELLPVIIKYEPSSSHTHEHGRVTSDGKTIDKIHVPFFLWQMSTLVLTAYAFYVLEIIIHAFMHHRNHHAKNSYHLNHKELPLPEVSVLPYDVSHKPAGSSSAISTDALPNLTVTADERQTKSTGWMIIIGDGIHNIADGLAIGAAFAESTMFGVTTSVAIACHELPTELGEYMVLIESGFTLRRALLFNFISACTAIIGFFIGASAAQNEGARTWIFSITAGTFAYIALVDLWPTLMPETDKFDWIRFGCVTFGYLVGVAIMFILTLFEERFVQSAL